MNNSDCINVLIAEDSAYQRQLISEMLLSHKDIENIEIARNGREVFEKIEQYNPDVLILDLLMPEIDGLTVFKVLSEHYPIPTIIFSSLNPETLQPSVQTLLMGAFDFISKPQGLWKEEFPKYKDKLISSVLYAAKIKKNYEKRNNLIKKSIESSSRLEIPLKTKYSCPKSIHPSKPPHFDLESNIIVMGTSTGGPRTIKFILKSIPDDLPCPILIVQHLDPFFMTQLAESLDNACVINVLIPRNGEEIQPGIAYLSPGGKHMKIIKRNNKSYIKIFEGEPVNFCIPSVDVLFFSAAEVYKNQTLGILLTGLGNDGAAGLEAIKLKGGETIAESEETSVVYGMPKAAAERGAAKKILPNYKIKDYMIKFARKFTNN